MFKDFSEAASYVKDQKIKMVDLKYCDFWGKWHHLGLILHEYGGILLWTLWG